ncbi:hypothetical protein OXX80_013356, partial [Metschnikowia pulcherrima]
SNNLSKLRKRIEQLEQELKEKIEQFDKQSKSDLTLHEKSLKEQIDLVRKGDADLTKLTSENGKLSSEISQLQSEVTKLSKERASLNEKLAEGAKNSEALKREITLAEEKVAQCKQDYEFKYNTELSKIVAEKDMKISQQSNSAKELKGLIEK